MEQLIVKVERVCYPPENVEGDWMIIATDKGTIKGKISWRPAVDEMLIVEGDHSVYQGKREFKFTAARAYVPIDPRDQLRYVCEVTPGFGLAMEKSIWETWGENWMERVESGIIKSLKGEKFDRLVHAIDAFRMKREESEAITWLMSIGATVNLAQHAWNTWQKETIGIVKSNCYRLAELPNYGFKNVDDSIRFSFQIYDNDPRRIRAAVVYALNQVTESGSTVANWNVLKSRVEDVTKGVDPYLLNDCVRSMFGEGVLVPFKETHDVALTRDFENAKLIWEFVK